MALKLRNKSGAGKRNLPASQPVLGVWVTPRTIYATLIQAKGDRLRVLRQFARQRSSQLESVANDAMSKSGGTDSLNENDISFNFMNEGGGDMSNLFLQSEFDNVDVDVDPVQAGEIPQAAEPDDAPSTFVIELQDILAECRDLGHEKPTLAFCVAPPEIGYFELHQPKPGKSGRKGRKKGADQAGVESAAVVEEIIDRGTLVSWLKEAVDEPFDIDRVEFISMLPDENGARYLALVPDASEPVAATIESIQLHAGSGPPAARLLDTEVSLYLGLARSAFSLAPEENTAVVRVGSDDVLIVFMNGDQLLQQKTLHSLTTFDPPETICSRILLQQDELGIGTLHNIFVIGEDKDDDLVTGLIMFYPETRVVSMQESLDTLGIETPPRETGELHGAMVPAAGVALRVLTGKHAKESLFEPVNLLPKRLQNKRVQVTLAWHTIVAAVLLFFIVLFFIASFYSQQQEIAETKQRIFEYPSQLELTESELGSRIDGLQNTYETYTRALAVLDTLLVGSDRWSRVLDRVSREAASVTGVWVDLWQPQETQIRIQGNAVSRERIVQFAERLNASVELLTFSEIREWPVYHYSMVVQVPTELPAATLYFRDGAITELD